MKTEGLNDGEVRDKSETVSAVSGDKKSIFLLLFLCDIFLKKIWIWQGEKSKLELCQSFLHIGIKENQGSLHYFPCVSCMKIYKHKKHYKKPQATLLSSKKAK